MITITQASLRRGFSFAVRDTVSAFSTYSCIDAAAIVSNAPAGCKASQRLLCTDPRYMHDIGAPSICRTEAAERAEQNTLSKTRRNSQTPQKRLKTLKNAISRRFPTDNTPPERESCTAWTRYRHKRRAAVYLHGHVKPPSPYQDRRHPSESR